MVEYNKEIYNAEWLKKRVRFHGMIKKISDYIVNELGPFETSLDLGAGDGHYSYVLSNHGIDATAVDIHPWELEQLPTKEVNCITHDLQEPLKLNRCFDLVLCIQMAEHLPKTAANNLCDAIANHCGGLLIFTAAPPGQAGDGHINCQPKEYWDEKLTSRGLIYRPEETERIREGWKNILGDKMRWLCTNIMIYKS